VSSINYSDYKVKYKPEKAGLRQVLADVLDWPIFSPWKLEERTDNKLTKVPVNAAGRPISIKSPWLTFDEAWRVYSSGNFSGIGLKLGCQDVEGYSLCGIDVDAKNVDASAFKADLSYLAVNCGFSRTYAEFSPSGRGVHILFFAKLESDYENATARLPKGTRAEIYALTTEGKRYFTLTGAKVPGFANKIADCTAELKGLQAEFPVRKPTAQNAKLPSVQIQIPGRTGQVEFSELPEDLRRILERRLKRGDKFSILFNLGHEKGRFVEDASWSEQDFYFVREVIEALKKAGITTQEKIFDYADLAVRASKLWRPKWDARRGEVTYGALTIEKSLSGRTYPPIARISAEDMLMSPGDPPHVASFRPRAILLVP